VERDDQDEEGLEPGGPGGLDRRPYADSLDDPLALARDVRFPIVRRGYAREDVDAFVAEAGDLIADLEANQSPESAVRAALDRVGQETSGILQRAQEAADALTGRSQIQADDRLEQAEHDARTMRAEAEARTAELDQDIESLWGERARLIDEIRTVADELRGVATRAAERMPSPPTEELARASEEAEQTTSDMPAFERAQPGDDPDDLPAPPDGDQLGDDDYGPDPGLAPDEAATDEHGVPGELPGHEAATGEPSVPGESPDHDAATQEHSIGAHGVPYEDSLDEQDPDAEPTDPRREG